ncbi:hypothetical protein IMG5_137790 [Ichthyophthirius multifiliis]|uniref:Uncharacterized protein n=1 Tax=Ichthyophthirius multifiliis TaxID=5932 RepID=G0QX27_ICHMU|nr:hypothetical protein IMG5_137790 [Ichthyophthirius multifiliis]EGR30224.1 hypothetical protein IMG5_137790 [Ichthyophthirius multifiliis]|eukprot:XP_004031820.1 hypothetical protein IMG5_137790 [Ichthyophthirius multifiliis]
MSNMFRVIYFQHKNGQNSTQIGYKLLCGCTFCLECLTGYFEQKISQELDVIIENIVCPNADCPKKSLNFIDIENILTIIGKQELLDKLSNKDILQKYQKKVIKSRNF